MLVLQPKWEVGVERQASSMAVADAAGTPPLGGQETANDLDRAFMFFLVQQKSKYCDQDKSVSELVRSSFLLTTQKEFWHFSFHRFSILNVSHFCAQSETQGRRGKFPRRFG